MVTVPRYSDSQVKTQAASPTLQSTRFISDKNFGGDQARSLSKLAQGLNSFGRDMEGIATEEIRRADQAALMEADNLASEAQRMMLFDKDGIYNKRGVNAKGATLDAVKRLDELRDRIYGTLNSRQQRKFDTIWHRRRQGILSGVSRHEAAESRKAYKAKLTNTVKTSVDDATNNATTPSIVEMNIEKGVEAIRANPDGLPPEVIERKIKEFKSGVALRVIQQHMRLGAKVNGLPTTVPEPPTPKKSAPTVPDVPKPDQRSDVSSPSGRRVVPAADRGLMVPDKASPNAADAPGDTTGTVAVSSDKTSVTSDATNAYSRYYKYLTPEDRRRAQRLVNRVNRTAVGQKWADAVVQYRRDGRFKTDQDALDWVREKTAKNPKLRDSIVRRLKARFGEEKAHRDKQMKDLRELAFKVAHAGDLNLDDPNLGLNADVYDNLTSKEIASLRKIALTLKAGNAVESDPDAVNKLTAERWEDPQTFMDRDLTKELGRLSPDDFQRLVAEQGKLREERKTKAAPSPFTSWQGRMVKDRFFMATGIKSSGQVSQSDAQKRGIFTDRVMTYVADWEARNGKKIDPKNFKEITDFLLLNVDPEGWRNETRIYRAPSTDALFKQKIEGVTDVTGQPVQIPPELATRLREKIAKDKKTEPKHVKDWMVWREYLLLRRLQAVRD